MKSVVWIWAAVFLLAGCSGPQSGPRGTTSSGGGEPFKAEFKDIGRIVVRQLRAKNTPVVAGVSVDRFEMTLENVVIEPTEERLRNEDEGFVGAKNFPGENRIELSTVYWAVAMDFSQKRRLIIHEILEMMGITESIHYERTSDLLEEIGGFSEIDIGEFQVGGNVAKILIEKMPWKPEEITVERRTKDSSTTYYAVYEKEEPKHYVACRKSENLVPGYEHVHHFCWIKASASIDELGVIHVFLGLALEGAKRHPLFRLFDHVEKFDYGVVRGQMNGFDQLELFP